MKAKILLSFFFILIKLQAYSQPNPSTEKYCKNVKVYSNNGYYVKAVNSGSNPWKFSFRYETVGYQVSSAAWAKYPVYTEVSRTEDEYRNVTIEPQEERNLFTAPQDPGKKTVYFIRVLDVFFCEEIK
jgi:hypothetical protein